MSKLSKTMEMVSGAATYQIGFYTTTGEASAYGAYGMAEVDGTTCYYGLGTGVDIAHGSEVKTPLKVNKGGTDYYMLTKGNAELASYNLTLAATSNQTITLKYKNRNSTNSGYETEVTKTSTGSAQSFSVRNGTTWTASIASATGWTAGSLSPGTSGTVSAAVTVSASAATYKTFTLTLAATSNQTITLKYKNKKSDGSFEAEVTKTSTGSAQNFTVGYGTTWTATVAGATGWTAGALSPGASGTVTAAVTVSAAAATYKTFALKLNAMNTNQTITLKYKNKKSNGTFDSEVSKTSTGSAQTFTVGYGTTWTASVSPSTGWNAGALSPGASGTVTAAVTISCAAATYKTFTLTKSATNASTNQTLTVQYQNKASNGTFGTKTTLSSGSVTLGYGSHWWGTVSGVTTGWNAGKITNPGGNSSSMTSNVTVSIAAATYKSFTLTKSATNASTNQTLTVQYQNKASSGSFGTKTTLSSGSASLGYGSHWWGTVSPSTGWNAGAVTNPGGNSSSLTSNVTVSVAAATHKNLTLTLAATSHQTITLKYKNYSGTAFASEVTKTSTSSAQSFTVGYGTTWTATVAGATYYTAGKLSPGASGTVTANTTVSAAAATWTQTYTLTLAATSHQTITLKYKNRNSANSGYEAEVTKTSTGSAQNFTVRRGTTWTATIAAATGYTAGALSASSGTVNGNTTVSAGAAKQSDPKASLYKVRVGSLTKTAPPQPIITIPSGVKRIGIALGADKHPMSSSQSVINLNGGMSKDLGLDRSDLRCLEFRTFDPSTQYISYTPNSSVAKVWIVEEGSSGSLFMDFTGVINANSYLYIGTATNYDHEIILYTTYNQKIVLKYTEPNASRTGYESQVTVTSNSTSDVYVFVRDGTKYTASIVPDSGYTNSSGFVFGDPSGTIDGYDEAFLAYPVDS